MTVKLMTENHLEFLSLKRGCTGLSESTHVKMPHCWKSHVAAHMSLNNGLHHHGLVKEAFGHIRYKAFKCCEMYFMLHIFIYQIFLW